MSFAKDYRLVQVEVWAPIMLFISVNDKKFTPQKSSYNSRLILFNLAVMFHKFRLGF